MQPKLRLESADKNTGVMFDGTNERAAAAPRRYKTGTWTRTPYDKTIRDSQNDVCNTKDGNIHVFEEKSECT